MPKFMSYPDLSGSARIYPPLIGIGKAFLVQSCPHRIDSWTWLFRARDGFPIVKLYRIDADSFLGVAHWVYKDIFTPAALPGLWN